MASVNIPVLVWEDHHGGYTAAALEWSYGAVPAAYDQTREGALQQLRRYFRWQVKSQQDYFESDFLDPELFHTRVKIRPEYAQRSGRRRYPCEETIELRVPCVRGVTRGGILCCSMPTLELGFYCHQPKAIQTMVVERIRQELAGCTPQELSRLLPPRHVQLDRLHVRGLARSRAAIDPHHRFIELSAVAHRMNETAFRRLFSPAYCRDAEVATLAQRLHDRTSNLLLVGRDGVGKTTLLVNAVRGAQRKANHEDETPHVRHASRFWHTSAARLIAGLPYLGQWQQRCEAVINELAHVDGVLCVESMIDLVRAGGSDPSASVGAFLLPYLQNGTLRLATEATPAELDATRRLLPGFDQVFEIVPVEELAPKEAREALLEIAGSRSRDLQVEMDEQVPQTVLRLHQRFLPYHPLPGRAGAFLRRLMDASRRRKQSRIEPDDALQTFVGETGLPDWFLDDNRVLSADDVFETLRGTVIGQDHPCRAAARLVCTFKTGLNDPRRPIGSLLFCGPTGVGKTQLAKTLSDYLFGHGEHADRLIRIDMSEYAAPWAARRLLENPDGTPSNLLAKMRKQPFAVVLFDEVEKASPEVFDMLLGLLDEGRLTDRYGRTTWFRTAIVIMTSNLGARNQSSIGFGGEPPEAYEREVRAFFRPEFFNRLDGIVSFAPLDRATCERVVRKELHDLSRREGFLRRGLKLRFGEQLLEHLVTVGFDPRYGARPLQRVIEHQVVSRLSRFLIENHHVGEAVLELNCAGKIIEILVKDRS